MEISLLINHRYRIDTSTRLDSGGMAAIHPGIDEETGEELAAKTLLEEYQAVPSRRAQFQREAQILAQLDSPHIVRWIDTVDSRHGPWVIMERLRGESLRETLEHQATVPVREVADLLVQAGEALDYLHERSYVHLDVKPGNLFLTNDGELKLIDFGISQRVGAVKRVGSGGVMGTAAYISPEHVAGGSVSPASDVYALACVAHELLTGEKPFSERGTLPTDAQRLLRTREMPALPTRVAPDLNLPPWVDEVLAGALQIDPSLRYDSASAFAQDFYDRAYGRRFRLGRKRKTTSSATAFAAPQVTQQWREAVAQPEIAPVADREEVRSAPRDPSRMQRWVRRELVKARRLLLVFALMVAVVLSFPLYAPAVAEWALGVLPGVNTQVNSDRLNLRAAPGTDAAVVGVLLDGQRVRVTGLPEDVGGVEHALWWPVSADVDGTTVRGWVADSYLDRTWLMNRTVAVLEKSQSMRDWWGWLDPIVPGRLEVP